MIDAVLGVAAVAVALVLAIVIAVALGVSTFDGSDDDGGSW